MDNIEILEATGLSKKEAKILYSCMQIEGIRASEISKKTGIERTNVYKILDHLIFNGYVTTHKAEGITKYRSIEPADILNSLKQNVKDFESNLSSFENVYKSKKKIPQLELSSGRKAIKNALLQIIKKGCSYEVFGGVEEAYKQNYFENLPSGMIAEEEKTEGRVILSPGEKVVVLSKEKYRISPKPLPRRISTIICGDIIAIFNWGNPGHVVLIKDKKISEDYSLLFENLWSQSKEVSKKEMGKIKISNLKFSLEED